MMSWWVCTHILSVNQETGIDAHQLLNHWPRAWKTHVAACKQTSCSSVKMWACWQLAVDIHIHLWKSQLHHSSPRPDGSFSLIQPLIKRISVHLTLVELLCNMSFWTAPVSQFLIFRKRGHLEGLPFCRDLVGEVLASAGGCKSTNESLLCAFEEFATSGIHLVPADWLAVMQRKAEETINLPTELRWINALIGYWLVKSIWEVVESHASCHSLVDFCLSVAFLYYA